MGVKVGGDRRSAFLAALAETANLTLAAERAKVSWSWVMSHRKADPAFRADTVAAIAAARERLALAEGPRPASRWRDQDGEELAVRRGNRRYLQVARARRRQWTPRIEERFLQALADHCNVLAACREVGLGAPSAYKHRQRWPVFSQRWDAALEQGYDRLAMNVVASAGAMLGDPDLMPERELTGMTFGSALQVLHLYRRRRAGEYHHRPRPPKTLDEVRPIIMRKLELIERAFQAEMTPEQRAERQRRLAVGDYRPPEGVT